METRWLHPETLQVHVPVTCDTALGTHAKDTFAHVLGDVDAPGSRRRSDSPNVHRWGLVTSTMLTPRCGMPWARRAEEDLGELL